MHARAALWGTCARRRQGLSPDELFVRLAAKWFAVVFNDFRYRASVPGAGETPREGATNQHNPITPVFP